MVVPQVAVMAIPNLLAVVRIGTTAERAVAVEAETMREAAATEETVATERAEAAAAAVRI